MTSGEGVSPLQRIEVERFAATLLRGDAVVLYCW
jgi:hypothetical protein